MTPWDELLGILVRLGLAKAGEARGVWFQRQLRLRKKPKPTLAGPKLSPSRPPAARIPVANFLSSWEWTTLRYRVLKKYGRRCMCCGRTPEDGVKICVDHIKPRMTHPELALEESNLQVLCGACNKGKGSWDETDWRASSPPG